MSDPKQSRKFTYVVNMATTPEKLWSALTGNEFWSMFSGPVESDWATGSPVIFLLSDGTIYSEGIVLESRPPHVLSLTWPNPKLDSSRTMPQRLTWSIELIRKDFVKLSLLHENMAEDTYPEVTKGWPLIVDGLKSMLEDCPITKQAQSI